MRTGTLRRTLTALRTNRPLGALAGELDSRRGLVFVHVPRCGGLSVERALRRCFPLGRRMIAADETYRAAAALTGLGEDEAARFANMTRAGALRRDLLHLHLAEGARLVTGHAPLGPHTIDRFGTHDFVTMLRSPAERMRSHLVANRDPAAGHGRSDLSISRFLETERARVFGALYVRYLSGLPVEADPTRQSAIDAARRAVDRLAFVGFLDAVDAFAARLAPYCGRPVRIGHENRGPDAALPNGALERIEALCAPDNAVYAHARERFGERRSSARV